jgi:pyrimidine operon attenuation protein/uracil phosphoribosyltransferase
MVRTIRRISHEIIEQNARLDDIVLLGIKKKGYPLAKALYNNIYKFEKTQVKAYELDVAAYRDDEKKGTGKKLSINLNGKIVILVDDVLQTGRTARAAMDAVIDLGRPKKIQFAVLVDRGHRELPIRPDYTGKNIPTSFDEMIKVQFKDEPGIYIFSKGENL